MSKSFLRFVCLAVVASLFVKRATAADNPPLPSGPQTDGPFRKTVLDSDQQTDGKWEDTVKDPMELAVAPDGRVFYAQRDGTIKMWKPEAKTTIVIGRIPVFSGLEEGNGAVLAKVNMYLRLVLEFMDQFGVKLHTGYGEGPQQLVGVWVAIGEHASGSVRCFAPGLTPLKDKDPHPKLIEF